MSRPESNWFPNQKLLLSHLEFPDGNSIDDRNKSMSEEKTNKEQDILEAVYQIVLERKNMADGEKSYVKSLFDKGLDKILSKIGEEATETAIAGKGGDKDEVVYEIADLYFHTLVLMGYYEIEPQKIYDELGRRFGMSGIEEKNSRTK